MQTYEGASYTKLMNVLLRISDQSKLFLKNEWPFEEQAQHFF